MPQPLISTRHFAQDDANSRGTYTRAEHSSGASCIGSIDVKDAWIASVKQWVPLLHCRSDWASLTGAHQNLHAKSKNTSTDAKESTDTDLCISVARSDLLRSYQLTCPKYIPVMGPFSTQGGGLSNPGVSCLTHIVNRTVSDAPAPR